MRSILRFRYLYAVAVTLLPILGVARAWADVKIVVNYEVVDGATRAPYSNSYRLSGNNSVDVSLPDGTTYTLNLGGVVTRRDGSEMYTAAYHVTSGDIVITLTYPTHRVITRIHTTGNSCVASRQFTGHFADGRARVAEHVTCSISGA
jgi:hypothetical protein